MMLKQLRFAFLCTSLVSFSAFAEEDVYTSTVAPFFEAYCIKCHGPEKQKSDYRLDSYDAIFIPGELGDPTVIPFEIDKSFLIEYIRLPEEDDMAMPPEGKDRPTAEEVLAIAHWVEQGAKGPVVDQTVLRVVEEFASSKLIVLPQSKGSDKLYVDFRNVKEALAAEDWQQLATMKDKIVELKMAEATFTPEDFAGLHGAAALKQLSLSGQSLAGELIEVLNSFESLVELNLFDTGLTDAQLQALKVPAEGLLYLGGTQVSPEALFAYQTAHPEVETIGDVDFVLLDQIIEEDKNNTSEYDPEKVNK